MENFADPRLDFSRLLIVETGIYNEAIISNWNLFPPLFQGLILTSEHPVA